MFDIFVAAIAGLVVGGVTVFHLRKCPDCGYSPGERGNSDTEKNV